VREYQLLHLPNEPWHVTVVVGNTSRQPGPLQSSAILHTPHSAHSHTQQPRLPVGRSAQHSQSLPSSSWCWFAGEEDEDVAAIAWVKVRPAGRSSSAWKDGADDADESDADDADELSPTGGAVHTITANEGRVRTPETTQDCAKR
jgi:hypothetical protein